MLLEVGFGGFWWVLLGLTAELHCWILPLGSACIPIHWIISLDNVLIDSYMVLKRHRQFVSQKSEDIRYDFLLYYHMQLKIVLKLEHLAWSSTKWGQTWQDFFFFKNSNFFPTQTFLSCKCRLNILVFPLREEEREKSRTIMQNDCMGNNLWMVGRLVVLVGLVGQNGLLWAELMLLL